MAISGLFIGANLSVSYTGASDATTGAFLNSGTCTWFLFDSSNNQLGTGALTYQSGSNGNYYGVIPATITSTLTLDALYTLEVTFAQTGYADEREVPMRAAYRMTS